MDYYHKWVNIGYLCPVTNKIVLFVWTDHARKGNGNSCQYCNNIKKFRTPKQINDDRKRKDK